VRDRHAEPDFDDEFAAELEVGLADDYSDDLVPTSSLSGDTDAEGGYRRSGRGDSA
jgi:hypothetical protein